VRRQFAFSPAPQSRLLELTDDPQNPDDTPQFGSELAEIEIVPIDDPLDPPQLAGIRIAHFAIEICISDDPQTAAAAPATILADVLTLDSTGVVLDTAEDVLFELSADTLPGCSLYRTDAASPVILIDAAIDDVLFPSLTILQGVDQGVIVAIPEVTP